MEALLRFTILAALCWAAWAQNDAFDPFRDRCARWHHSSMLRDPVIFVDGGVELYRSNDSTYLGFNEYIWEIDLTKSWDTSTLDSGYKETRIGRLSGSRQGANPPNMVRGALYRGPTSSSNKLYTFGGSTFLANTSDPDWQMPLQYPDSLWSFDTEAKTWETIDVTYAVPGRPNRGGVTEDIGHAVGFFLNGQYDHGSSEPLYTEVEYTPTGQLNNASNSTITYLDQMIVIDLIKEHARNVSTSSLGAPRVSPGLIYAGGFGQSRNGSLVTFGGMKSSGQGEDTFTNGELIDFTTVSVCDNFNQDNATWHKQTTTGTIPPPRIDFCVLPGYKRAPDNSSYNFYFYGGINPLTSTLYSDIYILSLPSFTWHNATPSSLPSDFPLSLPRYGHTCHMAGPRQMISVGGARTPSLYAAETTGNVPSAEVLADIPCDPPAAVALFDLSELTWGTYFNRTAENYSVPQMVTDVIGGDGRGGATVREPVGGFADPAVYTMFHPPPDDSAAAAPTEAASGGGGTSAGTVAGAVVGAVAGLAVVVGVGVWFRMRRARERRREKEEVEAATAAVEKGGRGGVGGGVAAELQGEACRQEMEAKDAGAYKDYGGGEGKGGGGPKELEGPPPPGYEGRLVELQGEGEIAELPCGGSEGAVEMDASGGWGRKDGGRRDSRNVGGEGEGKRSGSR